MNFKEALNIQEKQLTKLDNKLKKIKKVDLPGSLVVKKTKYAPQYYHYYKEGNLQVRKFINKNKLSLAKNLAFKSYFEKFEKKLSQLLKYTKKLNSVYEDNVLDNIYNELPEERKVLFTPIEPTIDQVLDDWYKRPYIPNPYPFGNLKIITNRGERVRSKSEKILSDFFFSKGINYKYECPLYLNNELIYPDFTFLHPVTREEIYWEHFGMLDILEYSQKALYKIDSYEKAGILLGKRLIVTFESESINFNKKILEEKINNFLK